MARARRMVDAGDKRRKPTRQPARRAIERARASREVLVVSMELVDPAPHLNDLEPVCGAIREVIAELLNAVNITSYRIAEFTTLSREEIRRVRHHPDMVLSMNSAALIARAFFFTFTEVAAIAEERLRERANPRPGGPREKRQSE